MRKINIFSVAALSVAALITATTVSHGQQGRDGSGQTTSAQSGSAFITLNEVQVKLVRDINVPVREPGLIENLAVREGDLVEKGQVIAELDRKLYELNRDISLEERNIALKRSENDVNARFAQKSSEVSKVVLEKSRQAVERYGKSISKTELAKLKLEADRDVLSLEQAESELEIAQKEVDLRESQLKVNQAKLDFRTIKAPFAGIVVQTYPQEGEWVNTGEPVMRIVDLNKLRVEVNVDATRFDQSLHGKPVEFTVKLANGKTETFKGKIDFVNPEIEPVNSLLTIRAEIDNRDLKLRPGHKGTLKVTVK